MHICVCVWLTKNSQHFVTPEPHPFELGGEAQHERMTLKQSLKQIIFEAVPQVPLPAVPDANCVHPGPGCTHVPLCSGAGFPWCRATAQPGPVQGSAPSHMLPLRRLAVWVPLVTDARVCLWSHAGRGKGLRSATTNKVLTTDLTICPHFHRPHAARARFQPGHARGAASMGGRVSWGSTWPLCVIHSARQPASPTQTGK